MPTISLIIPTYNRAQLIAETIASAFSQTVAFSEIIVVDDGSTDDTAGVLAGYGDRIRVIHCANAGVQSARNRGVAEARGDYVVFCDSDDLLEPVFVETISGWLSAFPETDAVYANLTKFTANTVEPDDLSQAPSRFMDGARNIGNFFHDIPDLYLRLFTMHPFYITGCTVRKTFFESIGGFDTRFKGIGAEDGEFTLRIAESGRTAYCTVPLTRIRRHSGNDSASSLYMTVGSAQILEYAAAHHASRGKYRAELLAEIGRLRLAAADQAFAAGKFVLAKDLFRHPFKQKIGAKKHLKKAIVGLPEPLRTLAWKATQAL